jgi:hypothetical protein
MRKRCCAVSLSRLFLRYKDAQMAALAVDLDRRLPFTEPLVPGHTLEARGRAAARPLVVVVLRLSRRPEVVTLVVQAVAVVMIRHRPAGDQAVHAHRALCSRAGVNPGAIYSHVPPVLHHEVVILVIDERDPAGGQLAVQGYGFHVGPSVRDKRFGRAPGRFALVAGVFSH